jgi:hypothetical protein
LLIITRALARQLRAVFRRAGIGRAYGGYGPRALFLTDQDTLRIRGLCHHAAVEYQAPYQGEPVQALLPLELLDSCEGKRPDPVQLDFRVADRATASWTDKKVPVVLEFAATAPDDKQPPFPPPPSTFATNGPDLWSALREAAATTDPQPTRHALSCIQFRGSEGKLIASDGQQALVQGGFTFAWAEDLLVPASNVYGCADLPRDQPIQVGKTEDWVTFRLGPWSISLKIEKDAHFPDVSRHVADRSAATSRLCLAASDSEFLQDALPRLPCDEDKNRPVTLDLNGQVLIRGRADEQSRTTELTLTQSQREGDPLTVNWNREYLLRALRLGFREVCLYGRDVPVLCDDGQRQYLWAPLNPDAVIPSGAHPIRLESPSQPATAGQATPQPRRRRTVMSEPTTPATPAAAASGEKAPAKRKQTTQQTKGLIDQTIALREAQRSAVTQANELIRALKQQQRESRLVKNTLDSLRQLQQVGV